LHGLKDQGYNIHLKASSHVIISLQKLQTLQFKLREHETLSCHLRHDNVVLQAKMNSLQRLVDDMTATNNSLWMQLKHHKRPKTKSLGKREKLLKLIHALLRKFSHEGQFLFVCSGTCKILGVGVMLGLRYDQFYDVN
jgi:hypothetical protein